MKFIDSIIICVKAGRGGDGVVSFAKAKGKPRLGPDGGDGGTGGSVILKGEAQINTLSALRYKAIYRAEDGVKGGSKACRGRCGEDLVIPMPLGTVIRNSQTGEKCGELVHQGDEIVVAKGGRHGLGNMHWATATHQTPEEFRPGALGEERELVLDLKLIADVGLAGFPNAGKSTLLSRMSAARPKIADYPFTTLVPSLGVVDIGTGGEFSMRSLVVADIPGLIEGASEGRGLGLQFLKHLERTSLVAYVIDAADYERSPSAALAILEAELAKFSPELAAKKALIVLNKIDLLDADTLSEAKAAIAARGLEVTAISGVTGAGIQTLKEKLYELVQAEKARHETENTQAQAEWGDHSHGPST